MLRILSVSAVAVAIVTPAASGAVRIVDPFGLERYAGQGAIGLAVPGAGPTITRESARNTLLTGKVESSLIGGTPAGKPLIKPGQGGPPDIYVTLPPPGRSENDQRYPIAVVGGGARGVLTSDSTRITGLVSLADVATARLRWKEVDNPVATLETLERRIKRNDRWRLPLTIAFGTAAYAAAFLRPSLAVRLLLLALAGNVWLAGWWILALLGIAAIALPLGWACAAVIAGYLLVLGVDPEAVALSPFGPSQAGRFYGVSNLLETMLLVPALLGTALLGWVGIGVGAVAVLAVAGNRFGADGGGLIVLLVALSMVTLRLRRMRLTPARAAMLACGVLALAAGLVGIDAALGGSSHVTSALSGGPGTVVVDIADRLRASLARSFDGAGAAIVVLGSLGVAAWVATRRPRFPITDALLAGIAVSLVVNDTPSDVLSVGAGAAFALYRWERERLERAGC